MAVAVAPPEVVAPAPTSAPRRERPSGVAGAASIRSNEAIVMEYQATRSNDILDELLARNERLLHHVLKRFRFSDEPYEDLFQAARLGFVKAAQMFDPTRGSSFANYAAVMADGEIRHHVRDGLLVRQPRWARSLNARLQSVQADFVHERGRPATMAELAQAMNLQEEGVREIIRMQSALSIQSLDDPGCEQAALAPDRHLMRSVRHENFSLPIEDRILLYDALGALSDIQKKLIYLLFFRDLTQQQVADELGLSQRAVSREQGKALARLKAILSKRVF